MHPVRILFIGFPDSIHTARWINQVSSQPWDVHLFPVYPAKAHKLLRNTTVHPFSPVDRFLPRREMLRRYRSLIGDSWIGRAIGLEKSPCAHCRKDLPSASVPPQMSDFAPENLPSFEHAKPGWKKLGKAALHVLKERVLPDWHDPSARLAHTIQQIKPDLIHSLEIQHAGYLTLGARLRMGPGLPPWIISNWGSDIYYFGREPEHAMRIRSTLALADYYGCECRRDVDLGIEFGFGGQIWPVIPAAGGYHLDEMDRFRQTGNSSHRRLIMLKGYQGWAGRALVGMEALTRCADALQGYEVHVYNAQNVPSVQRAAGDFTKATGIPSQIVPHCPHEEIMRLHGHARASIGLSISDGISTSLLEAMIMGSFPIQSYTACADEWVKDGMSGLLVPPEDPVAVSTAIRRALEDDVLVDRAAQINAQTARDRLDYSAIQGQVIALYESILAQTRSRTRTST